MINKNFRRKIVNVFLHNYKHVLGAQKNCLNETVFLSTHNICFVLEIMRKLIFCYTLFLTFCIL